MSQQRVTNETLTADTIDKIAAKVHQKISINQAEREQIVALLKRYQAAHLKSHIPLSWPISPQYQATSKINKHNIGKLSAGTIYLLAAADKSFSERFPTVVSAAVSKIATSSAPANNVDDDVVTKLNSELITTLSAIENKILKTNTPKLDLISTKEQQTTISGIELTKSEEAQLLQFLYNFRSREHYGSNVKKEVSLYEVNGVFISLKLSPSQIEELDNVAIFLLAYCDVYFLAKHPLAAVKLNDEQKKLLKQRTTKTFKEIIGDQYAREIHSVTQQSNAYKKHSLTSSFIPKINNVYSLVKNLGIDSKDLDSNTLFLLFYISILYFKDEGLETAVITPQQLFALLPSGLNVLIQNYKDKNPVQLYTLLGLLYEDNYNNNSVYHDGLISEFFTFVKSNPSKENIENFAEILITAINSKPSFQMGRPEFYTYLIDCIVLLVNQGSQIPEILKNFIMHDGLMKFYLDCLTSYPENFKRTCTKIVELRKEFRGKLTLKTLIEINNKANQKDTIAEMELNEYLPIREKDLASEDTIGVAAAALINGIISPEECSTFDNSSQIFDRISKIANVKPVLLANWRDPESLKLITSAKKVSVLLHTQSRSRSSSIASTNSDGIRTASSTPATSAPASPVKSITIPRSRRPASEAGDSELRSDSTSSSPPSSAYSSASSIVVINSAKSSPRATNGGESLPSSNSNHAGSAKGIEVAAKLPIQRTLFLEENLENLNAEKIRNTENQKIRFKLFADLYLKANNGDRQAKNEIDKLCKTARWDKESRPGIEGIATLAVFNNLISLETCFELNLGQYVTADREPWIKAITANVIKYKSSRNDAADQLINIVKNSKDEDLKNNILSVISSAAQSSNIKTKQNANDIQDALKNDSSYTSTMASLSNADKKSITLTNVKQNIRYVEEHIAEAPKDLQTANTLAAIATEYFSWFINIIKKGISSAFQLKTTELVRNSHHPVLTKTR